MRQMMMGLALAGVLVGGASGCYSDRPHDYDRQRPPVEQIDSRDRGLQSKDVVAASDAMATDLLALPELAGSAHRWTIVVDRAENLTADRRQDMDIFLERLRVKLGQLGRGRVQLIENRDKLRDLQSRELETASRGGAPGPAGVQPDFALYCRAMELPNRATSYYLLEFTLTDLNSREQVWTNAYEVKVLR